MSKTERNDVRAQSQGKPTKAERDAAAAEEAEQARKPAVVPTLRPLAWGCGTVVREDGTTFVGLKIFSEVGEFTYFFDPESTIEMGEVLVTSGQAALEANKAADGPELVLPEPAQLVGLDGQPISSS